MVARLHASGIKVYGATMTSALGISGVDMGDNGPGHDANRKILNDFIRSSGLFDVNVTLEKKIDNHLKFSGKVSEVSDTDFTVTDPKTGKSTKFAYEDVQQVEQKGLSKGWKIGLVVLAGVVIAAVAVLESVTE